MRKTPGSLRYPGRDKSLNRFITISTLHMKKKLIFFSVRNLAALLLPLIAAFFSCSRPKEVKETLPADFDNMPDTAKVAYMMKNVEADSVARFICDAALGTLEGMHIDTLSIAAAYAYEHYNDSCLIIFSREFDEYSYALPLARKMKIYAMAGESDPQRLGYQLGLEYVSHIRDSKMGAEDVRKEISAFKEACAEDSLTYIRFIKGFKTALKTDHGKDLPESIYNEFINY